MVCPKHTKGLSGWIGTSHHQTSMMQFGMQAIVRLYTVTIKVRTSECHSGQKCHKDSPKSTAVFKGDSGLFYTKTPFCCALPLTKRSSQESTSSQAAQRCQSQQAAKTNAKPTGKHVGGPKIEIPLNHHFDGIFPFPKTIQPWRYPHDYGNPHVRIQLPDCTTMPLRT